MGDGGGGRRGVLRAALAGAGLLALAGCGVPRRLPGTGSGTGTEYLYLTVLTGGMIGRKGWPLFVPGDFSVPAGSLVAAEIRCFDSGPAPVPAGYEQVRGTTDGRITVIAATAGSLAGAATQALTALPASAVAHTFTVPDLRLNVPLPPLSTVRFSFRAGAAGVHAWRCMAACGTGPSGTQGPMATAGWMQGSLSVRA